MKKIIAIVLSIMLLLGCAAATAEENGKTTIGTISINGAFTLQCGLPEGYQVKPILLNRDHVIAMISSNDETKPVMTLSVAYDETYSDVYKMNELDDEALALLEKTFTDVDPTIEITYGETGLGTLLMIARQSFDTYHYIDFLSIYEGYFIEFVMTAPLGAEDRTLTDDELRMCIDFLTELDFVPAKAEEVGPDLAGKTYVAWLENYNAEAGTLEAILREGVVITAEEAAALEVGDTLTLGSGEDDTVIIETMETDEYGDIIINDEIELRAREDGAYSPYFYDSEYMNNVAVITVPLTEDLVFLDGIDPETGDILDEPAAKTGAELGETIIAEGENGIGFATDNVKITFDEDGNVAEIERFYVPWQ